MPLTRDEYRQIIGRFATGVAVVTSLADGELAGMTVNSLTSVSLSPLLLLFCAEKNTRTHRAVAASGQFVVNLLPQSMRDVSTLFATPGKTEQERFGAVSHRPSPLGLPVLDGALGWLECRVADRHPAGDHTIFIGEVLDGQGSDLEPLLYYRGRYGQLAAG